MRDDVWDAIFTLRLMEKRIRKTLNRARNEEKNTYKKIINLILSNDKESARHYARQYLKIRKKRQLLERYLSKLSLTRLDLETAAAAKDLHDALKAMVKALAKIKKSISEIDFINEIDKARDILDEIGLTIDQEINERSSIIDEERIEELLDKIESVAVEELRKEIPEIPDETIEEEVKEIEEEREGEGKR